MLVPILEDVRQRGHGEEREQPDQAAAEPVMRHRKATRYECLKQVDKGNKNEKENWIILATPPKNVKSGHRHKKCQGIDRYMKNIQVFQ